MNILIISGIFPPDIGGPATYVPLIAGELFKLGHQVVVLTLSEHADHDDGRYPFEVIRILRRLPKPLRWLRTVSAILHLGRRADLLYVNGLSAEAVLANLILRKPVAHKLVGDKAWEWSRNRRWVHDSFEIFQKRRYSWKVDMLKALRSLLICRSDLVIVPSGYLRRWVTSIGISVDKVVMIPNAVNVRQELDRIEIPLPTLQNIVTVCRLVPWKGVRGILDALVSLKDVGLVIVGDGPERVELEHLTVNSDIAGRVFFAGMRSHEETLALMAKCDVFVLNSTYEGLPHIVLEAMGLGLAVVATSVGGTPEIVQDKFNGLLIPADDIDALRQALIDLLYDEHHRKALADQGKRIVETKFNIEGMVNKTEIALLRAIG